MVEMTPQQRFRQRQGQLAESFGGQDVTPEGGIGLLTSVLGPARYGASVVTPLLDDAYRAVRSLVTVGKGGKIVPTSKQVRQLAANEQEAARMASRFAQPTAREAARRFGGPTIAAAGLLNAAEGGPDPQIQNVTSPARIIPAIPGEPGTEVGVNMNLPPLKQKMDQDNATGTPNVMPYIAAGTDQGQNARERSFLERMSQSGLLSTLQGMARAERMYGVGPLAAFSESALDVQAAQAAADQTEADRQAKLGLEKIKNQTTGFPKLTAEATKIYDNINTQNSGLRTIQKMKEALTQGINTGVIGTGEATLKAIMNAFNIPFGTSKQDTYNRLLAQLKTGMLRSGRLLKADFKLLEEILPKAGTFQNREQLLTSLNNLETKFENTLFFEQDKLKKFGLPPATGIRPTSDFDALVRSRGNTNG